MEEKPCKKPVVSLDIFLNVVLLEIRRNVDGVWSQEDKVERVDSCS